MLPFSHPALELLKNAIGKAGYTDKVVIGMDVAASEFFRSGKYDLDFKSPDDPSRYITPDQLADLYKSFIKDYPGECFRLGAAALGILRGLSRSGAHSNRGFGAVLKRSRGGSSVPASGDAVIGDLHHVVAFCHCHSSLSSLGLGFIRQ